MSKTFTDAGGRPLRRHALNGPTMGSRWSALFYALPGLDVTPVEQALAEAVDSVDRQMSGWKRDSDLNRLNDAAPEQWVTLPEPLMEVLRAGLEIGRASGGTFDIGLADATAAWGFASEPADPQRIATCRIAPRRPAHQVLELDPQQARARKHSPARFDLNGIAKGYGVDRLAQVAAEFGIGQAVLSIDGEVRALGTRPDGEGWPVAIEAPIPGHRTIHSVIALADAAVATSGDYRHYVQVNGRRLGHTMDPKTGAPLLASPASVTVLAADCMSADAWATAFMVMPGPGAIEFAAVNGVSVLVLDQSGGGFATGVFSLP